MTLIECAVPDGPRTHALVIGVGHYRHFKDGSHYKRALRVSGTQLTSPPLSARAFADWLLAKYSPPGTAGIPPARLNTLELLVSTRAEELRQYRRPDTEELLTLGPATHEEVLKGFKRWRDRLWDDPQAVGFLFYCGHGVLMLDGQVLLLEDFGEDVKAPFEHAFHFDRTLLGMDQCAARRQYFFIDACQSEIKTRSFQRTQVKGLIEPGDLNPDPRRGYVYFASSPSGEAHGRKNDTSYFTSVVLDGLNGLGSDRNAYGDWIVRSDRLFTAIAVSLQHLKMPNPDRPMQLPAVIGAGTEPMHVVGKDPPEVPYIVWCEPRGAHVRARLSVKRGECELHWRTPKAEDWELTLPSREYTIGATFETDQYKEAQQSVTVVTPRGETALVVEEEQHR